MAMKRIFETKGQEFPGSWGITYCGASGYVPSSSYFHNDQIKRDVM